MFKLIWKDALLALDIEGHDSNFVEEEGDQGRDEDLSKTDKHEPTDRLW